MISFKIRMARPVSEHKASLEYCLNPQGGRIVHVAGTRYTPKCWEIRFPLNNSPKSRREEAGFFFLRQNVRRYRVIIKNTIETTTVSYNKMNMLHVQCSLQMRNFSLLNLLVLG